MSPTLRTWAARVIGPKPTEARKHARGAIAIAALLVAATGAMAQSRDVPPLAISTASSSVIEEHALAQQGFSIALASVVLQTHLYFALVEARSVDYTRNTCMPLDPKQPASGAWEVTIPDPLQSDNQRVSFYYDDGCTRLYTTLDQSLTDVNGVDGAFYTVDGKPNGTLITSGMFNDRTLQASGIGTFVGPTGTNAHASLGIACVDVNDNVLDCSGGVVQNFASLNQAIGSVTPLKLDISNSGALTFTTLQPAAFRSGTIGSMTLGYTDSSASDLLISGGSTYGSDTVSGEAGSFSLFPAPPTDWTSIDSTHDTQFQIHVIDNTTRQLSASITTISTGKQLASATLDQSGTGKIVFSDQSQSNVLSWVIADAPAGESGPVTLNQRGLTGTWYNAATGGQGIVMEVIPDLVSAGQGILFGGWFTFATAPAGGADKQRWYTLQGQVSNSPSATLGIYTATGGNFNAAPKIAASAVGQATISFSDCSHGTLSYTFSDGTGRSGNIPLSRLDTNASCSPSGDNGVKTGDSLLSGAWYDPNTSGQGFVFNVVPGLNTVFAGWYTYAPNGQAVGGGASQRWYTLQAPMPATGSTPAALTLGSVPIYTATGGVFDNPTKAINNQVGVATLAFTGCNTLKLTYNFSSGSSSGQIGTINLQRVGPTPAGCNF